MSLFGVVLGHSFVYGAAHAIESAHHDILSPQQLAFEFRVSHFYDSVTLQGRRGGLVPDILPMFQQANIRAECVILDIGTNDLVSGDSPIQVAAAILHTAQQLVKHHHVKKVAVCSILHRNKALNNLTPPQFADAANKTNSYIKQFCRNEPNINYHTHKGFWGIPVNVWSRDNIHPNTPAGRSKYKKSLRRALLDLASQV